MRQRRVEVFPKVKKLRIPKRDMRDPLEPNEMQKDGFKEGLGKKFFNINGPTGCGKTTLAMMLSTVKMKERPNMITMVTVPQDCIAPGFRGGRFQLPDGTIEEWHLDLDLTDKYASDGSKTEEFVRFLSKPRDQHVHSRTILCTHSAFRIAFERLCESEQLDLLYDINLWIDESHHLSEENKLGRNIQWFLENAHDRSLDINLMTASPYRHDGVAIIPKKYRDLFHVYHYPYDAYLRWLAKHSDFESLVVDFVTYDGDYIEGAKAVLDNYLGHSLIYLPHPESIYGKERPKLEGAEKIIDVIGDDKKDYGEFVEVAREGKVIRGINHVDETDRDAKKRYLAEQDVDGKILINKDPDRVTFVVAQNMCKEGFDHIWADQCVIIGARHSLPDMVQTIGRLLRAAPGKKHVRVVMVLKSAVKDKDKYEKKLNDWLVSVYLCMTLEELYNPVRIPTEKGDNDDDEKEERTKGGGDGRGRGSIGPLWEYIPNEKQRERVQKKAFSILASICSENQNVEDNKSIFDRYAEMMRGYLINEEKLPEDNIRQIQIRTYTTLMRRQAEENGVDVGKLGIKIISEVSPYEALKNMLRFQSEETDGDLLERIKEFAASAHKAGLLEEEWERTELPYLKKLNVASQEEVFALNRDTNEAGRRFEDRDDWMVWRRQEETANAKA